MEHFNELLLAVFILLAGWLWDIRIQRRNCKNQFLLEIRDLLNEIEDSVIRFAKEDDNTEIEARMIQSRCHLLNLKVNTLKQRFKVHCSKLDDALVEFMDTLTGGNFPSKNEEADRQRIIRFYPIAHKLIICIEEKVV